MTDRETSYTSPRWDAVSLVPREATRILELGCSTGATAKLLKERQPVEVVGVERDVNYARAAASVVDRVLVRDLDDPTWLDEVEGSFDCVVAADVLEHLINPWRVLRDAADRLTPDGCVVLSLPNIRHNQTLVGLLRGRWPYRNRGTHDSTHLRFFTLREIRGLVAVAGLALEEVERTYRFLDRPSLLDPVARVFGFTPGRELFVYQYLVLARRTEESVSAPDESVPPWVLGGGRLGGSPNSR